MPQPKHKSNISSVLPFEGVQDALEAILECLSRSIPFRLWLVARLDDDDWTVIKGTGESYGIRPGVRFDWNETYCSRMVRGEGPMFAETASSITPYLDAKINAQLKLPIGAYIGFPLLRENGDVAGTLCALDPAPQALLNASQRLLVETFARCLSTLLKVHAELELTTRNAERLQYIAEMDVLTGLYNRRGWELALSCQEVATSRFIQNSLVVVIDLDDLKMVNDVHGHEAGDNLLRLAAETIRKQFRDNDVVARIGGDEFAVLVVETSIRETHKLLTRLRAALLNVQVAASIGHALRLSNKSMSETVKQADAAMYEEKRSRKQSQVISKKLRHLDA